MDKYVKCPTTGKILEVMEGDNKVVCFCGKSNPRYPGEDNQRNHTHFVRFLEKVSVDDFNRQEEKEVITLRKRILDKPQIREEVKRRMKEACKKCIHSDDRLMCSGVKPCQYYKQKGENMPEKTRRYC